MIRTSTSLRCTGVELAYLAALSGVGSIVGVPDPFAGWVALEIDDALIEARDALAARRWVTIYPDGHVEANPDVADLVQACGCAEVSFRVTYTPAGGREQARQYHITPEAVVEVTVPADGSQAELAVLEDLDELQLRVQELLRLDGQQPQPVSGGTLPVRTLQRAVEVAEEQGGGMAAELLRQAGLELAGAEALGETLAQLNGNGVFVTMVQRGSGWAIDGVGLLDGTAGMWRLRSVLRDGQEWVEAVPCGAEALAGEIERLIIRAVNPSQAVK